MTLSLDKPLRHMTPSGASYHKVGPLLKPSRE
jgi:hypothetical protein